jgi:hypothetical protein
VPVNRGRGRQGPAVRPLRPSALRPGARPGGAVRRTKPVRRASAGITPTRAGALLAILAGVAATYGLASSDAFATHRTTVTGTTWTSEEQILERLAIPPDSNVFTLRTGLMEQALTTIPAVRQATVSVALPDEVRVVVSEREALMVWRLGERRFLVDAEGLLFAKLPADPPAAAADLPVIDDARFASLWFDVGSTLDDVDLDAALRLASLHPADVGSGARSLVLRVDDTDGFTMRTRPASWTAVFGFYTPTLRTTDLIPGQVRLLRSLLAGRETSVARVILADDRSGTIIPVEKSARPTPDATSAPKPTPKP